MISFVDVMRGRPWSQAIIAFLMSLLDERSVRWRAITLAETGASVWYTTTRLQYQFTVI